MVESVEASIVVGGRVGPYELDAGVVLQAMAERLQPGAILPFTGDDGNLHVARVTGKPDVSYERGQLVVRVALPELPASTPPSL